MRSVDVAGGSRRRACDLVATVRLSGPERQTGERGGGLVLIRAPQEVFGLARVNMARGFWLLLGALPPRRRVAGGLAAHRRG